MLILVLQLFVDEGIEWIGGSAPLYEPDCGFDGRHCVLNVAGTVYE